MKRAFLFIILILLAVTLIFYAVSRNRAYKAQIESEKTQKEKNLIAAVENLKDRHNAFDWAKELSNDRDDRFFKPVLTLELEKLWLTDRPTLFIGSIRDISTLDQNRYVLKLSGFWLMRLDYGLELICSKQTIDSLLEKHPDVVGGINNGIAVIAKIKNIKSVSVSKNEGETENMRIGEGEAIDIIYVDDLLVLSF